MYKTTREKIKSDVNFPNIKNLFKVLGKQGSCLSGEKCRSFRAEVVKRCGSYMRVITVLLEPIYCHANFSIVFGPNFRGGRSSGGRTA